MDRPPDVDELPADLKAALEDSPCRFARAAAVYYVPRGALAAPARETIHAFLSAGPGRRSALIVETATDGDGHAEALKIAQRVFVTLLEEFTVKAGDRLDEVVRWTAALSRAMREPPILACGEQTFITLALSPPDQTRARYAPRLCLVVTWNNDVLAAERSASAIMVEAYRRAGGIYNAKELYLLLPGARG